MHAEWARNPTRPGCGMARGVRPNAGGFKRKSFDILIFQKSKTSENRYHKIAAQHSEARQE